MTGTSADRPATAPVRRQATALSRHGLALIVAAAVGIAMVGGLWALPTHPVDRCEPALAQRLADRSPQTDYTYTAEGTIGRTIPLGSRDVRLDGRHRAPDRLYERYVEGKQLALFGGGADEAVRIGQELWVAPTYGRGRAWEKGLARSVAAPDLAVLPTDRVAFLLEGSTEPSSSVEWAASPTPGGRCRLKGTIVPSAASPARRILTVEVAPDSELPDSIHEEWLDFRTPEGERTHDLTWRFQVAAEAPIVEPPAPHLVQPTLDIPPDRASLPPSTVATIDGLGTAVADLEPDAPGRGEVRVTLLEVQEDDSYGEIVPYPGTTFLATRMRQEGIQATSQGAGSMGWELSSSGGSTIPGSPPWIEGGPDPKLPTVRTLRPGDRLEGWMHYVVPAEGGLDAYWYRNGPIGGPPMAHEVGRASTRVCQ